MALYFPFKFYLIAEITDQVTWQILGRGCTFF